jgi:anthranilate phosphoribosyltransferase
MLGPLTNPARAAYQLVGASRIASAEMLARSLHRLGSHRALVVCGNDELDEVSLWGETTVFEVSQTSVQKHTWTAVTLGLPTCRVEDLKVTTSADSAALIRRVLAGEQGPASDIIAANAGAALLAANRAPSIQEAVQMAAAAIAQGRAGQLCERLVQFSRSLA